MFNIFRRQVGAKIILGYLASLSLMVIIGGVAVVRLTQVTQTVSDLTNNQAVELDLSNAMVDQIVLARLYTNRYILYQNQADLDAFHASFSQLQELLAKAEQKITNPERAAKLPALQENAVVYGAAFDEIVGLLAQRARIRSEMFNAQEMLMALKLAALRVNAPANNATLYHLALGNLQTDYLNMRLNLLNYIVTGENRFVALFDLNYQEIQKHLADLHSASTTPAQQQTLADIEVALQTYAQGFTEVQTGYTRLNQLQQTQFEIAGPAMSQAAFDVAAQVKQEFQAKNADIHAFVVQTQIVLLATILSAIAIGLGMGGIAARRITRPLRQVTQTAQQIATVDIKAMSFELVSLSQGKPGRFDLNLTASPLQINSPDELGQLGQAFNQIIFSLGVAEQAFRSMTDYLNEMAEAACRVAQGQLEVNVAVRSPEDVLGNALAHMVANLRTAEVELRQYQEHLEELVVERAAALRESQRAMTTLLGNLPGMAYRCRNDRDWTMEFISQGCQEFPKGSVNIQNSLVASYTTGLEVVSPATASEDWTIWSWNGTDYTGSGTITHGSWSLLDKELAFINTTAGGGAPTATTDNYHLNWPSWAIDRAGDYSISEDLDWADRPHFLNAGNTEMDWPDRGAYESDWYINVAISKTAQPAYPTVVQAGDPITYTLVFSHAGTGGVATGVVITDIIPINLTNEQVFTTSDVPLATTPGSGYIWTTPEMALGQGGIITITGLAPNVGGCPVANTTSIWPFTSGNYDPDPDDDVSSANLCVPGNIYLPIITQEYSDTITSTATMP